MRISDWSSDVCSSDLAVPVDLQALQAAPAGQRRGQPLSRPGAEAMSEPQADAGASSSPAPAMPAPDRWQKLPTRARTLFVATTEIGRASCRERVCQYV